MIQSVSATGDAPQKLHITEFKSSTLKISSLSTTVETAFQIAMLGQRQVDNDIYSVGGFCGKKFRLFLNTIVATIERPRYLEIGIYQGATFCAAISGNNLRAVGIDDWSWEKGQKLGSLFFSNLARHHSPDTRVSILEQDFRTVDFASIGMFNMMFYDGSHSEQDQYDGLLLPQKALDDEALVIVDDWNLEEVRNGTTRAIRDCNRVIEYSLELRTSLDNSIPSFSGGNSDWHNGTFIAVLSK